MKYCTKCGYKLVDEAKFCNACGAPVEEIKAQPVSATVSENPYASIATDTAPNTYAQPAPVYANEPKTEEQLRAEEQAVLDKFSLGLKHERMAWKFSGIFFLIANIFIAVGALFIGICAIALDDYSGEAAFVYSTMASMCFVMAIIYLPITIINLVMKKKLEGYRAKLYTDCKDGIGHYSVGSIVFAAFFNGVAMVFIIVYFIQAKNNAAVIERIKARQNEYNSQQ